MNNLEEERIKIILLGNSPGKTSLINSLIGLKFNENTLSTLTPSYTEKVIEIGNKKYYVNLWDTCSQEKYISVTKLFFKDSDILILVYDITNKRSFEDLPFWLQAFNNYIGNVPIIGVVGNKKDLYKKKEVNEEEAKEYANKINAFFTLTSAKNDPSSFYSFIRDLLKEYIKKKNEIKKFKNIETSLVENDRKKLKNMKNDKNRVVVKDNEIIKNGDDKYYDNKFFFISKYYSF